MRSGGLLIAWLSVVLCAHTAPAQLSAGDSMRAMPLGQMAATLQRSGRTARFDYAGELNRAALLLDRGEAAKADALLLALGARTYPDSRAIVLRAAAKQVLGDTVEATNILRKGLEVYPHSVRLGLAVGQLGLARGTYTSRNSIVADKRMPLAARYQVASLWAYQRGDGVGTLLDLDRAYYAMPYGDTLGSTVLRAAGDVQAAYITYAADTIDAPRPGAYPEGSLEAAYAECLLHVSTVLATETLPDEQAGVLDVLVRQRLGTLRRFAERGHLARWPDPILVDLYVLDHAGHLEWSTYQQYARFDAARFEQVARQKGDAAKLAAEYLRVNWARDVDAALDLIEQAGR